ncbi:MAG: glycosyltransferase [Bacteroidetes bacterium]|nr:MAG: glycosyltransferase [Bacteroidota bacterium]
MKYSISYIISTRNRLSFLKITLGQLISELQEDEEVVVVDSNSTDGAKEYLENLYNDNKIHQFISESDRNQAHGWNKAMLMAKGEIIKKVIDDDLICLSAVRLCKDFMFNNPEIDICISNDMSVTLGNKVEDIGFHSRLNQFKDWKAGKSKSFSFGDVHMLIRKTSLPYIGLYDTSFTMMDWEYSLRISYLRANIAYYTGFNALSISHGASISSNTSQKKLKLESKRACPMYEYAGDASQISFWSKIKIFIGKYILFRFKKNKTIVSEEILSIQDINNFYGNYQNFLIEYNKDNVNIFSFEKSQLNIS